MSTNKKHVVVACLFFSVLTLSACTQTNEPTNNISDYQYNVPLESNDGWETRSVTNVGLDLQPFIAMMNALNEREINNVHSILVVKNGKLVFEEYFAGSDFDLDEASLAELAGGGSYNLVHKNFNSQTLHLMASVTKTFTSILFGIAMDKGYIQGIDGKMFDVFPDYAYLNTGVKNDITFKHMLTMSSGIPWNEDYAFNDARNSLTSMLLAEDPIQYVLGLQMVGQPGNSFIYNSGTTNLLGEIIKRKSGMSLVEFADQFLFAPLGITSFRWIGFPTMPELTFASSGLYIRSRDMAKIGQLYLQNGSWNGSQIVSNEWVEESTSGQIAVPPSTFFGSACDSYGYQWWIVNFTHNVNTFVAAGFGGQFIIVVPSLDMVIVITQGDYYWEHPNIVFEIVNSYILQAVN